MLGPLGSLTVTLPSAVTDASGTEIAPAGPQTMTPATMAAVLAAADPGVSGAVRDQTSTAVWSAIATAIGDGLATPLTLHQVVGETSEPTGSVAVVAPTQSMEDVLGALTAGPVVVRELKSTPIMSIDLNPRGVDAVVLDRADVAAVLGHVAPGRLSAPNPGFNFQVLSNFADEQLPTGVTRFAVAYTATKALLGADDNVLSVDTSPGDAAASTIVEVPDEQKVDAAQSLSDIFGPVEVRVAEHPVAGIDVIVHLGTDYLSTLNTAAATTTTAPVPGSGPVPSGGTVAADGTS